jgi:hypothetical protein
MIITGPSFEVGEGWLRSCRSLSKQNNEEAVKTNMPR